MPTYQLPNEVNANFSSGLDQLFVYIAGQVPFFIPMVLFSTFLIIFLGGLFAQKRQSGQSDAAQWFTIGAFITSIIALFMRVIDGLINLETVIITIVITFIGVIWLFLDSRRGL